MADPELHFFAANNLNGDPILEVPINNNYVEHVEVRIALTEMGWGRFRFNRKVGFAIFDSGAFQPETFVRLLIPAISSTRYLWGWFLNDRTQKIIAKLRAGENFSFGGPGPKHYLTRAILWDEKFGGGGHTVDTANGVHRWAEQATPGRVMNTLINEDQANTIARFLPDLTQSFGDSLDSASVAWSTPIADDGEFELRIGDNYLTDLFKMEESDLFFSTMFLGTVGTPRMRLDMWQDYGTDRSGTFGDPDAVHWKEGKNIRDELTVKGNSLRKASHSLVEGLEGAYGRAVRTSYDPGEYAKAVAIQHTNTKNVPTLNRYGLAWLRRQANNENEIKFETLPGFDPAGGESVIPRYMPGMAETNGHYWIGDYASITTGGDLEGTWTPLDLRSEVERIMAIRLSLNAVAKDDDQLTRALSWRVIPEMNVERDSDTQPSQGGGKGPGCHCLQLCEPPAGGAVFVDAQPVGADSPDMSLGIQPGEANLLLLDFASTDASSAPSAEYQDINDPPTFTDATPQALTELEYVPTSDHDMTLLALDDPDIAVDDSARILHEHPDGRHAAIALLYRGVTIADLGTPEPGNGVGVAPSITVATNPGDIVVAGFGWHYYDTSGGTSSVTNPSDQTMRGFASKSGTHRAAIIGVEKVATGASTTVQIALSKSRQWSGIAIVLPGAIGSVPSSVGPAGTATNGDGARAAPCSHSHDLGFNSDDGAHYLNARDIQYANEESELESDNVQDVVDELADRIDALGGDTETPTGTVVVGTFSAPPTQAEVEAAAGSPGAVVPGWVYVLQDSATGKQWLAYSDGVQWRFIPSVLPAEAVGVTALTSAPAGGWAQTHAVDVHDGVIYFAYVRGDNGNIELRTYTIATAVTSSPTVLRAALLADTHASPSVVVAQLDRRIHVFYSDHAGSQMYEWISTNPEDISAGTESNIDSQLGGTGYTYVMRADLASGLHIFVRYSGGAAAGQDWGYAVSTVNGTWSALTKFFEVAGRTAYPFLNKTGDDRVDVMAIDGSSLESNESILFFSFDAAENEWTAADGTSLTLPVGSQAEIMVWDGSVLNDARGRYDVRRGLDGHPRVLFATMSGGTYTLRHARWDGEEWVFTALFSGTEPVQGDACFNSLNTNIIYFTDSSNEIRRLTTLDEVTWSSETLTTGTTSVYPISEAGYVLWLTGSFTDADTYNVGVTAYGLDTAAGASDYYQRIVVGDDTGLGELVIRRTGAGAWEFSLDGSSWESVGGGGALDDLSDVVITSPQAADRLRHDGSDWVNSNLHWEPMVLYDGTVMLDSGGNPHMHEVSH